ncbi:NAD(P)-binding protein [Calocera cornea HHB12733]|uniref:NAD(P)-binding protein n=1 Tax=Calocera cornea HHB12733 TaxID=1353952 RepID=A0A165EE65_9BASI|nr:NAD(P)-binding protein [Calocera cornea HHB12733]
MSASPAAAPPAPARRVAIVTGAAGDLGRAIALKLAADGLDICLTDLPPQLPKADALAAQLREKHGARCHVVGGDVSQAGDVQRIVDECVAELGGLDVMVANAGVFRPRPLLELTVDEWDTTQTNNARSCLLCYQAAAKQMIAQGRGGRIIGGCSVAGLTGAALCGAYCASKFAIRGLTMCAALEWAPHGITVNAYAPGFIEGTKMSAQGAAMMGITAEQWKAAATGLFPMKRLGKPEEIAGIVSYFASDAAGWTTGESGRASTRAGGRTEQCAGKVFAVDGGMHIS